MSPVTIKLNVSQLHLSSNFSSETLEEQREEILDRLAHDPAVFKEIGHQVEEQKHQHDVYLKHLHDQEISAEVFLLLIVVLQVFICFLQKRYKKQFQEVTFVFLVLYPLTLLYHYDQLTMISFIFLSLWVIWGSWTSYLMYLSMGPPRISNPFLRTGPTMKRPWKLSKGTPQKVYAWFLRTHTVCYYSAGISFYFLFFSPGIGLVMMFMSLYFGVLGRDCAQICGDRISNTIGYLSHETPPTNVCALCDHELKPTLELMLGTKSESDADIVQNPSVKLECGHEFHKKCILGWTLVGKRDTCPFCCEKVDLRSLLPKRAWDSPRLNIWWLSCLTLMRYLLVWNPIATYISLYFLKIFHFEPLVGENGKPLY